MWRRCCVQSFRARPSWLLRRACDEMGAKSRARKESRVLALLLALDAVVILLLYQIFVRLRVAGKVGALARAASGLHSVLFLLEVAPVVIVFVLVAVFAAHGDALSRASHAATLWSLWLAVSLGAFLCILAVLARLRLLLLGIPAIVLALIPIVRLTPLPDFIASTTTASRIALLPIGLLLAALCYLLLIADPHRAPARRRPGMTPLHRGASVRRNVRLLVDNQAPHL